MHARRALFDARPAGSDSADFEHDACADRPAAFAHGEAHAGLYGDRPVQLEVDGDVVTGLDDQGIVAAQRRRHVRDAEEELRRVTRSRTACGGRPPAS